MYKCFFISSQRFARLDAEKLIFVRFIQRYAFLLLSLRLLLLFPAFCSRADCNIFLSKKKFFASIDGALAESHNQPSVLCYTKEKRVAITINRRGGNLGYFHM